MDQKEIKRLGNRVRQRAFKERKRVRNEMKYFEDDSSSSDEENIAHRDSATCKLSDYFNMKNDSFVNIPSQENSGDASMIQEVGVAMTDFTPVPDNSFDCSNLESNVGSNEVHSDSDGSSEAYSANSTEDDSSSDNEKRPEENYSSTIPHESKQFLYKGAQITLKVLYSRDDFVNSLSHRFHRNKINESNIEDIYDGSIYKSYCSPGGILANPNNISFTWNTDGVPLYKSSKFSIIICGTCDLPAKALVMNMNQFNGKFGCSKCLTQDTTAIDMMHGVFGGAGKKTLQILTDPTFKGMDFSLSHLSEIIDKKLLQIKPPNFVSRYPRSLKANMAYLKVSELKNFHLYYALPIFITVMSEPYLSHYAKFVHASYILCSESISNDDISLAESLMIQFVSQYEDLYGLKFMSANLHALLHLADCVRKLGPLWVTSCFPFEDLNGKMTRLVHGTRSAEQQINNSFATLQNLPQLLNEIDDGSEQSKFIASIKYNQKFRVAEEIDYCTSALGYLKQVPYIPYNTLRALASTGIFP
ncbi:hypothetical protein B566_EDAN004873, partial [Ephemera danica]